MVIVDVRLLAMAAPFNRAGIVVPIATGRWADKWRKLPVADLAAALADVILYWIAARFDIAGLRATGRAAAVLFVRQFICALIYALLAWGFTRWPPT
jgi:hypothetical protein